MLCDQVREHLSAHLDKELTAELSAAVRAHLETCAACRTLAGELRATADLLGRLPVRAAPEHLAADVIREIERRGIVPAGAPVEGRPQERTLPMRRARLWPRALAVAATVLLAVGIVVLAYLGETGKEPPPLTSSYEVAALPAKHAAAPDQPVAGAAEDWVGRWDEAARQNRRMSGNGTEPDLGANLEAKEGYTGLADLGQLAAGQDAGGGGAYVSYKQLADRSVVLANGTARKEGLDAAPSVYFTGGTVIDRDGNALRRLGGDGLRTRGTVVTQAAGGEKTLTLSGSALAFSIAPDAAKTGQVTAGPTLPLGTTIYNGTLAEQQAKVPPPAQTTWAMEHGEPAATENAGTMRMAKARPAEPATETPPPPAAAPPATPAKAAAPAASASLATPAKAAAEVDESVVEKAAVVLAPAESPAVAAKPAAPVRPESKTDARSPAATTVPAVRHLEEAGKVAPAGPTVVAKMMDDVANGRVAADQLARVATRDNLRAADNQLIIRVDPRDEADRRLVQLFKATGWRSLAPIGERQRSVSRLEVLQDERGEPRKPPAAVSAGFASPPPAEKGRPLGGPAAPGGVYWQASRNGEQVWLVLADRDSLSRFGSRLAQVEGMDVDADSSTEFRAIARLQQQLKHSLARQAVAADTEGVNAEAPKGEAGRGGQTAAGLSSKVAMGKAGEDTAREDRAKDAKQEAAAPFAWRGPASAPAAAPAAPAPADKAAWRFEQQSGGGTGGAAAAAAAQRPQTPQPSRGAYDGTPEGGVADAPRAPGAPEAAAKMKAVERKPDAAEAMDFFDTLAARNAPSPPANAVLLVIRVQPSEAQRAAGEAPAAVPAAEPGGKTSP